MSRLPFADARVMSLSEREFEASVAKLGPHRRSSEGFPLFDLETGTVEIRYKPGPPKTFGGLLSLPQAQVELAFDGVSELDRAGFVHRFDIAFQRGGG